jgi:hypothetical protein
MITISRREMIDGCRYGYVMGIGYGCRRGVFFFFHLFCQRLLRFFFFCFGKKSPFLSSSERLHILTLSFLCSC